MTPEVAVDAEIQMSDGMGRGGRVGVRAGERLMQRIQAWKWFSCTKSGNSTNLYCPDFLGSKRDKEAGGI